METPCSFTYQIINETLTGELAFTVLDMDMESYWGGSASGVIAQRVTNNYFPTVSSEDFANGFYDKIEALQGVNGTYYVSRYLSFETVTIAEEFARNLVERKFPTVPSGPSTMMPTSTPPTMMPSTVSSSMSPTKEPTSGTSRHVTAMAACALVMGSFWFHLLFLQ